MSEFDAKAARAKRPLPLWVDAFMRDTALLETDEVGAYIKILMAMWGSRDVALPDDPRKLARAAGVGLRTWNSRVGPTIMPFLTECPEGVTQKRLRREAVYIEHQCKAQSDRKRGNKPGKNYDNPLNYNDPSSSADYSVDASEDASAEPTPEQPTQQPNIRDDGDDTRATRRTGAVDRVRLLKAMGLDASGTAGPSTFFCSYRDMVLADRWHDDLGFPVEDIYQIVRETVDRKNRSSSPGLPSSFEYFNRTFQRIHAEMKRDAARPTLTPIDGGRSHVATRSAQDPRSSALRGMAESVRDVIAAQQGRRRSPDDGD